MYLHSFDPEIAAQVGINAAVIYQNILFWVEKNAANNKHLHEGRHWTYNSIRAYEILFPYLTGRQVNLALGKLVTAGFLLKDSFNKNKYDRTLWYTITAETSTLRKAQMDFTKKANGFDQNVKPIPDSKPDKKHIDTFDQFWTAYPSRHPGDSKQRAFEWFKKRLKDGADPDKLILAARAFTELNKDRTGEDRQFIPMAATWLRGLGDADVEPVQPVNLHGGYIV